MSTARKLIKKLIPTNLFLKLEPLGHLVEAVIANIRYGFPARGMHIIGVTGTNGKTTTTFMIHNMLTEAGIKSALTSTVGYGMGEDITYQSEKTTTADAGVLQKRLKAFRDAGVNWVVVETSSHALSQNRIWGLPYEIAVMTNLSYDHLDYHKTMERYGEAKRKLFQITSKHGRSFGVTNADDAVAKKFANITLRHTNYGIDNGDLRAKKIKYNRDSTNYIAEIEKDSYDVKVNMIGDFNVYNSLAAIAVGRELGLSKDQIEAGIAKTKSVDGRVTFVDEGQDFQVIVDFAATPDAFTRILETLRPIIKGKLVTVFGAPGRRDETKRPVMGEIAANFSQEVIVTEDDDRDADGNEIRQQILKGVVKTGKVLDKDVFVIGDREEAIRFALSRVSSKDDAVVLLGKGHEKSIERGDTIIAWNETEIARKLLKEIKK